MSTTSHGTPTFVGTRHDGLLAANIPAWLRDAPQGLRQDYWHWAVASLRTGASVQALLARVQAPDTFAEDELVKALAQQFNRTVAVRDSELVWLHHEPGLPNLTDRQRTRVTRHNLLQAAMSNFAPEQLEVTAFGPGSVILPQGRYDEHRHPAFLEADRLGIEPRAFARLCRELDLGGRYQQHLLDTLGPVLGSGGDDALAWPVRLFEQHFQAELQVRAREAHLRGWLGDDALQCLLGSPGATWQGRAVQWGSLRVLVTRHHDGFAVQPTVLMRQAGEEPARCLVYTPGEGPLALREYPDWQALCEGWRVALLDTQASARLQRQVGQGQQAEFARRLLDTLRPAGWFGGERGVDATADLGLRWAPSTGPVAAQLRRQWLEKALGDARTWMVPSAERDRQAHAALMARLQATGMNLATLGALFVPGLGLVMAAVGAVQLLRETYQGVDDWTHGQRAEALGHFADVALNLGFIAVSAGTERLGQAPGFVDGMLPVVSPDGKQRLVALDLEALAVSDGPPAQTPINASGLYLHEGQAYIRIAGRWYLHAADQGRDWVRPPQSDADWKVAIQHNGQGGWRATHENPAQWTSEQLMRRFGPALEAVDAPVLEAVRRASGLSRERLVRLHLDSQPLPVEAQAGLEYLALAPVATPASLGAKRLAQQFSGLSAAAADAIAGGARRGERQVLAAGRVPLRLAEQGHLTQREARLNQALLALWRPGGHSSAADRLLMAGAARLPGWPAEISLSPGEAAGQGDVAQWLWRQLSEAQRVALGCSDAFHLRQKVFEHMAADRAFAAQAIGQVRVLPWLRPPVRQAGGLWGYALSGRGALLGGGRVRSRLRRLYPTLDPLHLQEIEVGLGGNVELGLLHLEAEFGRLNAALEHWRQALVDVADDGAGERLQARVTAADMIRRAWQRDTGRAWGEEWEGLGYMLDLSDLDIGDLPALDADFSHIDLLILDNVGMHADPSPFLDAFTQLRALDLTANRLPAVPAAVARMPWLTRLHLDHNALQPHEALFAPLTRLRHLQHLSLNDNPMTLPAAAMRALGSLLSLRQLHMDNFAQELTPADIDQVARLANLRFLSLRDNDSELGRPGVLALGRLPRLQALRLGANTLAPDVTLAGFPALRELDLEGCELAHWPDGLSTLMNRVPLRLQWVSMLDNPLVELPPLAHLMFFRGPRDPGTQPLDIEQGNLDNTALQRLLEADIEPHLAPPLVGGALPVPGANWRPGLDEPLRHTVDELDALPQARDFLQALDRLATSPATARARAAMRQRIHELLRAISVPVAADIEAGLSHLRDDLFALADDALNTCGDGLELVFNRWETRVLFYRASRAVVDGPGALQPVVDMARGVLRGELLDERAMAIMRLRAQRRMALFPEAHLRAAYAHEIAELTPERSAAAPALDALDDLVDLDLAALPDEAEMRLLLRRSLATRLGLPLQPQPLLYGELASAQMIDRVAAWVEQQATPERLLDWLVHQPAWRDLLSRRSPLPFEQVREHWSSGQDYLFELGRPQPEIQPLAADVWAVIADQPPAGDQPVMPDMHLSEADQEAARQRLSTAERAAVDALVRTMTQQTL
ncbi:hypothetical protein LZ023_27745 [Pseudomonas silvicola]|nr:hypothetical protein LZ023_27745 [Pseudomonas silvicola]